MFNSQCLPDFSQPPAIKPTEPVLLLTAWSVTTPRWFQLKHICDSLPMKPLSKWEAMSVASHKAVTK